jgi:hypothetical protein
MNCPHCDSEFLRSFGIPLRIIEEDEFHQIEQGGIRCRDCDYEGTHFYVRIIDEFILLDTN